MWTPLLFLTAAGLAMDAVAVSIAAGLAHPRVSQAQAARMALCFGGFQAVMPLIGAGVSEVAGDWLQPYDHWIALLVLGGIGLKMIREGWARDPEGDGKEDEAGKPEGANHPFAWRSLLLMGLATSLDALAVGLTFGAMGVSLFSGVTVIGIVTILFCWPAVHFGARVGSRFAHRAEMLGGSALLTVGLRIFFDHLHRGV